MTEELVPVVVGVNVVPSFSDGEMAFGPRKGRILFHVEVMAADRVVNSMNTESLAKAIGNYVRDELEKKLPQFDREDKCSRETYEAFLRYQSELVEIWQRHKDATDG